MIFIRRALTLLIASASLYSARAEKAVPEYFIFDTPDETITAESLGDVNFYDASIAPTTNGAWFAWLEFVPGKGDLLWVGLRHGSDWGKKIKVSETPGMYANPTVILDRSGMLWLTYETATREEWRISTRYMKADGSFSEPLRGSTDAGNEVNHRVIAEQNGGMYLVTQQSTPSASSNGTGEVFSIAGTRIRTNVFDRVARVSGTIASSWAPSVAIDAKGKAHAVWDAYEANSFNVYHWSETDGKTTALAATPSFEAHAQIAAAKNGKLYVAWEEDGENWGKRYIARTPGVKSSTHMEDNVGPVHRFRKLHFAEYDGQKKLTTYELPQPSFELANKRVDAPPGLKNFGAFYENAQLVVDGQDRPWIVYRHFYVPWIGLVPETHKQNNMRLYARCLLPDGWSKLYSFDQGQGDGMQRVFVAPTTNGIAVTWTTGRTDRRKNKDDRGVAFAEIHIDKAEAKVAVKPQTVQLSDSVTTASPPRARPTASVGNKNYELFFGDMHRHTDISLCFSPVDGTIDDAYRFAIDAAPLDFLGITDHTHDLDMGNGLALIWHRSQKEVSRHRLVNHFIPLYSYERSRGDTDHNVFSLRNDVLRPHTYPLSQFWQEIDTNTFTVAHQPFNAVTWNYKDDVHRPLLEIYQGFRNDAKEEDAKQALLRGNHVGFIAASDHLSTAASFACVWAEKAERESIFRALQARRTFAATDKIGLKVTCGDHWMGERFETNAVPEIQITVKPTAKIEALDVFVDGTIDNSGISSDKTGIYSYQVKKDLTGPHMFWVRVTQADGNRAWSSPLWIEIKK